MYIEIGNITITNEPVILVTLHQEKIVELENIITDLKAVKRASMDEYTGNTYKVTEIYNIARQHSGVVYPLDSTYVEPTLEALVAFLEADSISENAYVKDEYGCEDFSFDTISAVRKYFRNIPFGIASVHNNETGKGHMLNCCYVEGTWYWVEPQGDKLYTELADCYTLKYIII